MDVSSATAHRRPDLAFYVHTLRGRLSLLFLALSAMGLAVGLTSVWGLIHSNEVSTEFRTRWLPNIRWLGDLNNFTSDYRTAEANSLLAASEAERNDYGRDILSLDAAIRRARQGYEQIPHNGRETELYSAFSKAWTDYKVVADRVTALAAGGRDAEATVIYRTQSRRLYDKASDVLGQLAEFYNVRVAQASERSIAAYERVRWLMASVLGAATLMLVIVVAKVHRSVSLPLLELGQAMRRLAANETGIEIGHTDRVDEIGEMARAVVVFRANAIELMHSQRGLAQQATMLEEKLAHEQFVTEWQRNFVSTISHEFRTPLAQIDAHAQRLISMRDRLAAQDIHTRAGRIRIAVNRISHMINDLVDTSRVMEGDMAMFFHPEPMDLLPVLREICHLHREISPHAIIIEDFDPGPLPLHGDPKLLFQAFSNLVANAIKYATSNPKVILRAHRNLSQIDVVVEDFGIGIPEDDLAHIFARYYRGKNASGFVGTGVGLFLVLTVLNLHDGAIIAESEEGKGSRFKVTLQGR